jgi:hypothetical protein
MVYGEADDAERHASELTGHYTTWQAGAVARASDRRRDSNPFPKRSDLYRSWEQGWKAIDEAIAERLDMAKY